MGRPAVLKIDIISDLNRKGFGQAESALSTMGRQAQVAATALGAGLVAGGIAAVNAASDLGESMNAVSKVFGPAAATITDFGQTAATQVGLSQAAFQGLATSTGSLLTNFGYSQQEAAEATTQLATRAADMASVFNTDVDTALNAINAGLRGETEPLRAFGVNLNDAALKGKALELGLYSGTGALDANAKAAAAQALIMEQTAATAGDFADTSDSVANSQRVLSAQVTDLAAQMGENLTPVAETVIGKLQGMVEWAGQNQDTVKRLIGVVAGFVAIVLGASAALKVYRGVMLIVNATQLAWTAITKGMAIAQRVLNAAMRANPIGIIITLIAGLVAILVTAYQRNERFRAIVDKVAAVLRGAFQTAFRAASNAISTLVGWLRSAWEWVSNLIGKVRDLFSSGLGKIGDIIGGLFTVEVGPGSGQPVPAASGGAAPMLTRSPASRQQTAATGGVTINVTGALDPDAVARQIRRVLTVHDRRTGQAYLTPAASGVV